MISVRGTLWAFLILSFFSLLLIYHHRVVQNVEGIDIAISELPLQLGPWSGRDTSEMDAQARDTLQLSHYIRRYYRDQSGHEVYLYIGYWNHQTGDHQASKHSPALCLPANGWKTSPVEPRIANRESDNAALEVSTLVGQNRGALRLFYYWFFAGDTVYRQETYGLLHMTMETLLKGRSDGGIVEISTNVRPGPNREELRAEADETVNLFLRDFLPELQKILSRPYPAQTHQ